MNVDEERQLVVLEPEVLDADVAALVADLEVIDAFDAGDLLDQVDELGLEHRAAELPALAITPADERVQEPAQLRLDVLAQAIAGADRAEVGRRVVAVGR